MRLFGILLLFPLAASAQMVTVHGVAPLEAGKTVELRIYDELISNHETVLASGQIDVDGEFELKGRMTETQYAFVQIGRNCAEVYLGPGKDLELTFVAPANDNTRPTSRFALNFFSPAITGGTAYRLNHDIHLLNQELDAFLKSVYPVLVQRRSPKLMADSLAGFEKRISVQLKRSDPFVTDYARYSIADVEQTFVTDRDRLFVKYLKDSQPRPDNPAYMDFMMQFFQGTVNRMVTVDKKQECEAAFKGPEAFGALDKLLRDDPQLQNHFIRTAVLINGIDGLFGQRQTDRNALVKALNEFAMLSSNSVLATAARNIAQKHSRLVEGALAPEIVFADIDGKQQKLSDLRGSYVFLELTDALNPYCQRETNVIRDLSKEFNTIRFLTVCVGNTREEMRTFMKNLSIDWTLGSVSATARTVNDYDIRTLPIFFIIGPDGRFYRAPSIGPSHGVRSEFLSLSEKMKAASRRSIGK